MSDEALNMSMRKFLKQVGVTSQQAIETAVRAAAENGDIRGGKFAIKMTLVAEDIGLDHAVEGEISVGGPE